MKAENRTKKAAVATRQRGSILGRWATYYIL